MSKDPRATALPEEATLHADTVPVGPGEQPFPCFLRDWRAGHGNKRSIAGWQGAPKAA